MPTPWPGGGGRLRAVDEPRSSSVSQVRWTKHGHMGDSDDPLHLEQYSNSRLCDLSLQTHWELRGSIFFTNCVWEEVGLVNVCLVPLGLWAISGSGPGLFVPPLGWADSTYWHSADMLADILQESAAPVR